MTAWGDGTPAHHGTGAVPQAGPPPSRHDDTRVVVLIVMFATAVVLVGVGAFLVGRGPSSGSDDAGVAVTIDAPMVTPTVSTNATTIASTVPATTGVAATPAPTTEPPVTTAAASTAPSATTPPTTQALVPVDTSARARADLLLHFDNHDRLDLDAAYGGLSESFAPPFDEFVAFWGTDVANVDSPIDDCTATDATGTCRVRFFITYSDQAADEAVRGTCSGQLVELTLQDVDGRFLIDDQRNIEPLTCP